MEIDTTKTEDFYCDFVLNNKIEVEKVRETDKVLAFYHTRPSWSFHIVIVPKQHVTNLIELQELELVKEIFAIAKEIIQEFNLDKSNYRIVTNGGSFQDSKHLHFHLLSGQPIKS